MREKPSQWGCRTVSCRGCVGGECSRGERYYRRLVAYYVGEARLHMECRRAAVEGWRQAVVRWRKAGATIRRLRSRAERAEAQRDAARRQLDAHNLSILEEWTVQQDEPAADAGKGET